MGGLRRLQTPRLQMKHGIAVVSRERRINDPFATRLRLVELRAVALSNSYRHSALLCRLLSARDKKRRSRV